MSEIGEVYFIQTERLPLIKIGYAERTHDRLQNLQTASPFDLYVIDRFMGTKRDERAIQRFLRPFRHRREWFRAKNEVYDFIEDLSEYRLTAWIEMNMDNPNIVSTPEDPMPGLIEIPISPYVAEHCRV